MYQFVMLEVVGEVFARNEWAINLWYVVCVVVCTIVIAIVMHWGDKMIIWSLFQSTRLKLIRTNKKL